MDLYDLEAMVEDADDANRAILRRAITFSLVLDDHAIPPIDMLDGLADRELILANQQVLVERKATREPASSTMARVLSGEPAIDANLVAGEDDDDELHVTYEVAGKMPEGAFLFDELFPVIHVGKHGLVKQVDLMRRRVVAREPRDPVNTEFNNMLVSGVKEHGWDELVSHFTR